MFKNIDAKYIWIGVSLLVFTSIVLVAKFVKNKRGKTLGKAFIDYTMNNQQKPYIDSLNKAIQDRFKKFIKRVEDETDYSVYITSGYRTFEKQDQLHKANSKNAKPGYSLHNYGLAIDINLFKGDSWIRKASPKQDWINSGAVKIAKEEGLRWGGDFSNYYDPVHFDYYKSTTQLLAKAKDMYGDNPEDIIGNNVMV